MVILKYCQLYICKVDKYYETKISFKRDLYCETEGVSYIQINLTQAEKIQLLQKIYRTHLCIYVSNIPISFFHVFILISMYNMHKLFLNRTRWKGKKNTSYEYILFWFSVGLFHPWPSWHINPPSHKCSFRKHYRYRFIREKKKLD